MTDLLKPSLARRRHDRTAVIDFLHTRQAPAPALTG